MSIFYPHYPPKLMWYYLIMFFCFYCVPIFLTFVLMFWYEMSINQYFINQASNWFSQSSVFARMKSLKAHYFLSDKNGAFTVRNNVCMVIKRYDNSKNAVDAFHKDPKSKKQYRLNSEKERFY